MDIQFPKRTIHLDFHTGPAIPDVGKDFEPESFAHAFAEAHVDSVTVFAKCHHGHLYYDTDRPERHPGLVRNLDLMGEQIEALHRHGIRAPVYISVQCDEYAANTHPEWQIVTPDDKLGARNRLSAGWQILDMSSPYQDYLADQFAEVLQKYGPVDGIFMDMCWDQPSLSKWAIDGMKRVGLDPKDEGERRTYARRLVHQYMSRFKQMLDEAQKGHEPAGIWFNSRPKTNLGEEKKFLRHVEIECLPTGGWGYAYFPYVARYVRPLGLPTLSHTGRFHRSWGDFGGLKPEAALLYECSSILSQGLTNGIGDQLHPRGVPDKATYNLIGRVYGHIRECEPFVEGGGLLSEIGVVIDPGRGDHPGPDGLGVIRALQQLRCQFDLVSPTAEIARYPLVIVSESVSIDAALRQKLREFVQGAGALLVSGMAALDSSGQPALPEMGIIAHGESPFTATYLRVEDSISEGIPPLDHVMYERGFRMTAAEGAEVLCRVVEPYFERSYEHFCSHGQTPADQLSPYAAAVQSGRVITISVPIFTAYGKYANVPYRQILGACIQRLLPEPLIRDGGPAHLEATILRKDENTIVHLLSFCPVRRAEGLDIIEDAIPLVNMPLSVRLDKAPRRVFLAHGESGLPFKYQDGYAHTTITTTRGHEMVVFEE